MTPRSVAVADVDVRQPARRGWLLMVAAAVSRIASTSMGGISGSPVWRQGGGART